MTERSQARRTRTAAGVAMLAAALLVLGGAGLATARVMEGTASEAAEMAVGSETALSLAEVLRSVERHHPLVAAVLEERAMADARQLASRGAFDLRFEAGSKLKPEGFYETYEAGVGLKQPTTLWGSEFYAGYRIGDGDFAAWDGDLLTNEGGEFRAGVRVPLLRDRAIDKRRAGLREADLDVAVSTPLIERNLLELRQAATMASSGMRVSLARQLLEIAEVRQVQLKRRVDRGAVPEIDLVDNERLILERQARRIDAERAFEQATVNLGLFLRDENGMPRPARAENLPRGFPEEFKPDSASLESDVEEALERQPLLQQLALEIEKAELKLQLAENRYLPGLAVSVGASNDVGAAAKFPDDKGPAVLEARLEFELPVQRREARGEIAEATAKLRQLREKLRFTEDKIAADVRKSVIALTAAHDQVDATRRNQELADRLRLAEERKLDLGTSNLLSVNIRELQAFDAAAKLISTQADYFKALANYQFAIGGERS
jgi:outer membrane protein TolC